MTHPHVSISRIPYGISDATAQAVHGERRVIAHERENEAAAVLDRHGGGDQSRVEKMGCDGVLGVS